MDAKSKKIECFIIYLYQRRLAWPYKKIYGKDAAIYARTIHLPQETHLNVDNENAMSGVEYWVKLNVTYQKLKKKPNYRYSFCLNNYFWWSLAQM